MTQVNSNAGFHSLKEQLRTNQKEKKDDKARVLGLAPAAVKALEPLEKDAVILAENAGKVAKGGATFFEKFRLMAFTNEVGEACRPALKGLTCLSYIPAFAYIGASIVDKYKKGEDGTGQKPSFKKAFIEATFQGLASVIIPTVLVHKAAEKTEKVIENFSKNGMTIKAFGKKLLNLPATPVSKDAIGAWKIAAGLATLAVAIKPIDKFVENVVIKQVLEPCLYGDEHEKKSEKSK